MHTVQPDGAIGFARTPDEIEAERDGAGQRRLVGPVELTIVLPTFNERGNVEPLIARLRGLVPEAHVRLGSGNAAELLQRLRTCAEDVIIAAGIPDADDLASVVVDRQSLVAVVHVHNPLAQQKSVGLRRLLNEQLVLREKGSASRAALEEAAASVRDEPLDATLVVDTREGALAAVAAGLGVAVIAENELLDDPRLVMVDIRDPSIPIEERMICRASERDTAICAALFDLVPGR